MNHKEDIVVKNKSIISMYRTRTCITVAETLNITIVLTRLYSFLKQALNMNRTYIVILTVSCSTIEL